MYLEFSATCVYLEFSATCVYLEFSATCVYLEFSDLEFSATVYCNLSNIHPWAMNLSGFQKRGVGVFSRVVIFLLKRRPPHMQLV